MGYTVSSFVFAIRASGARIVVVAREVVIQKTLALGLLGLAIAFLSPIQMALAFSVLGQGHFLGAYYYQWKAKKIRTFWACVYVALAALFFYIAVSTHRLEWFVLCAGVLFFIHHFFDEVTLWGKERSFFRALELTPPILLYSSFTADVLFGTALTVYASALSVALMLVYVFFVARKLYVPDALSIYFALITISLLFLKWIVAASIAPETLLGSVILYHYICWYIYFYFRFAKDATKQSMYVREMLAIHAIVFGVYAVFLYTTWGSLNLGYVFLPIYFYIWAILHILFSVRMSDFRAFLKW